MTRHNALRLKAAAKMQSKNKMNTIWFGRAEFLVTDRKQ
jgi:hypothetical protein